MLDCCVLVRGDLAPAGTTCGLGARRRRIYVSCIFHQNFVFLHTSMWVHVLNSRCNDRLRRSDIGGQRAAAPGRDRRALEGDVEQHFAAFADV